MKNSGFSSPRSRLFTVASAVLGLTAPMAMAAVETFNTAGTFNWVCPGGVTSIQVEAWGGGGAGGSAQRTTANSGGGGGGGGAYAKKTAVPVIPGNSYTITIPAAATAPASGFTNGQRINGSNVTFNNNAGVIVTANGGTGGACAINGTGTLGAGGVAGTGLDAAFAGGSGSTNTTSNGGAGGSGASDLGAGNNATGSTAGATRTGSDALHNGGAGGAGRTGGPNAGLPGTTPGGGGGGAKTATSGSSTVAGGTGGLGQVILSYTDPITPNFKANNTDNLNLNTSWTAYVPHALIAEWNSTVTSANTTSLGANLTFAGIKISDPGGPVTINAGNTLTLGTAPLDIDLSTATQDLTLNCDLAMGAANVWDVPNGRTLTLGGAISGSSAVTKQGIGTAILSGPSTYTGSTTVTGGTLNISGTGSITGNPASSKINIHPAAGNAVVNYSGGNSTLFALTGANVVGTASVFNMTAGNLTISPGVATGTQSVSGAGNSVGTGAYGFYNISGGTLKDTNRFTMTGQASGNPTSSAASTLQTAVVHVGGNGFIDQTNGEWWLNYSLGQITVADSGKIDRTGSTNPFGIFMNHAAGVTGGGYGVLNLTGANAQVILGAQPIRFGNSATAGQGEGQSGFVNLAAGLLSVGANVSTSLPAAPTTVNNAYFNFAGGTVKATGNLSGWIPVSNASINFNSNIFGPIDNSALSGAPANFTGGLTVDTDTFSVALANPLQAPGGVGVTQADLSVIGGSGYVAPPAVIFSSSGVIAGGSPASGYALISGGSVTGIVITSPGTYAVGTTPTVTLIGGGGSGASVTSAALNTANTSGGLTKSGTGTLTLSGANTYTGPTLVSGGALQLNGSAATLPATSDVTVNPGAVLGFTAGAASTLDLTGKPFTLGGSLALDIGSSGVNDSITVNDFTLTANSTISLNQIGGVNSGGSYTVLTSANPITTGGFGITVTPSGRLTGSATVNANTVTVIPVLAEGIWTPTGGGDWSNGDANMTAGNWTNYKPTVAGDAALFGSAITAPSTVNVDSAHTVGFLRFDNSNAYTIGSNGSSNLTLGNGTSPAILAVGSGNHTIAENVAMASNVTASPLTGTTLTLSGNLSGTGTGLEMAGAGTLVLSGINNSYTGTTTVSAGTLSLTGSLAGGAAVAVTNTGILNQSSTGVISGSATFTHSSTGTSTLAGVNTYTGTTAVSAGKLILSGARTGTSGTIAVSNVAGQSAILDITNGTYAMGSSQINVGNAPTTAASGTVNQSGGAISFTSGNMLLVGQNTVGNTGTYNLSGGSITTNTNASRGIMLGVNSNPTPGPGSGGGTFNLSGTGTINMTAASGGGGDALLQIGRSDTTANNTTNLFNQTGGTANVGILTLGGSAGGSVGVDSTLTLTGGVFAANQFTKLSAGDTNTAVINIGGTADVTLPAFPTARGSGSTATITFDGGILRPRAASPTFMGGLTNAFIKAGGATFNTDFDITVTQALLTDPISTGGGLTKDGANTLTLTGANTYTGATVVNGGTLQLNDAAATTPVTSGITANTGGTLGFTTAAASLLDLTGKPVTLDGGNIAFDIGATGVNDSIAVQDFTLTANSTFSLKMIGAFNTGASYTLLTSTNPITTGGFALTPAPAGRLSGALTVGANTVTIMPTLDEGVWNQSGGGNWSVGDPNMTAGNWTNYKPTVAGDAALFGSAITAPSTVSVDSAHAVGYLRFDNTNAYTIGANGSSNLTLNNGASPAFVAVTSGSHSIAENVVLASDAVVSPATGTTLTMSGVLSGSRAIQVVDAGKLVLTGANTYSGNTAVNAGTLQVAGAGTLGGATAYAGAISLGSGAVLQFSNNTAELTYTLSGPISGAGSINKDDGRRTTLTLSGATNSFSGGLTVSKGRVTVASAPPLSTGTITCIGDASEGGQLFVSGTPTITNNLVISGVGFPDSDAAGPDTGRAGAIRAGNGQTYSGTITLAGNSRIGYIGSGTLSSTYSGQIAGPFALDFYGGLNGNSSTQTFVLANTGTPNDHTGNTSITCLDYSSSRTGGKAILQLGANDQIPNGPGKGNLVFNGADADHQTILELNGFNETVNGLSNAAAAGAIIRNNPATALPATLTVGDADTTSSFSGVISDGGVGKELALVKTGAATVTLAGANTFSGDITVNNGTLIGAGATNSPGVTVLGSRSNTRTITINSGGTLQLNSGNVLGANHSATTAPTLVINSGGIVTNGGIATNNALNNIELNGGTLTSTTGHTGSTPPNLPVYGAWNLNGSVTSTGTSTISTSDATKGWIMLKVVGDKTTDFNVTSGTLTVSAPVVDNPTDGNIGSLSKSGAGAMVLSGANTYSGDTIVSAGTLQLADNAQLKFVLGATSGLNNSISGAGTVSLEGDFVIDTTAADALATGTWTLENVTSLTGAYGSNFTVIGFTDAGNNKWTKDNGPTKKYTFDETTGVLTLEPSSAYATWAAAKGLDGTAGKENGKADDPDGDGKNNLFEFAFDGDPLSGVNDGKIVGKVVTLGGNQVLTLTLPVRSGAPFNPDSGDLLSGATDSVVYRIEGDKSLNPFADAITEVTGGDATTIQDDLELPDLSLGGGWTYRTFRAPDNTATESKAFLRAKVTSDTP